MGYSLQFLSDSSSSLSRSAILDSDDLYEIYYTTKVVLIVVRPCQSLNLDSDGRVWFPLRLHISFDRCLHACTSSVTADAWWGT